MTIVNSLIDHNEFFIFRDDNTEVRCIITKQKLIKPFRYKLTPEEVKAIQKRYFSKKIIKKSNLK
ncbi:MAG: hypothetical protein GY823_11855 [Flavobacteriaceae bacterium]|nr:hypothetical protein [Flavobacteriaceae bacterium]